MDKIRDSATTESQLILTETIRKLLSDFRQQLLGDIRLIVADKKSSTEKKWLKSAEVRKMLGISHGTLQSMRNNGYIPFTRIGGVIYYPLEGLNKTLATKHPVFHQNT